MPEVRISSTKLIRTSGATEGATKIETRRHMPDREYVLFFAIRRMFIA